MFKKLLALQLSIMISFLAPCLGWEKNIKITEQSEELLLKAVEFHGHLGPYLVLGLKAGLYANQILGREPMETEALIKTKTFPPESCFADGVQLSTGCTFGKGNIFLTEGKGLQVTFKKNNQKLTLKLKNEIIEEINSLPSEEKAWEKLAKDLYQRKTEKIFEIIK
jgi:formylmethanofuran dehydrogenase subunit E